jgi:hypothetical protein
MRRRILLAPIAALALRALLAAGPAEAAATYVPGTEDVPLMPGLAAQTDGQVVFDKPQGRIVQSSAKGTVKRADVLAFYAASLPPLGWQKKDPQHFEREGEALSLDFTGKDGALVVGFTLKPH